MSFVHSWAMSHVNFGDQEAWLRLSQLWAATSDDSSNVWALYWSLDARRTFRNNMVSMVQNKWFVVNGTLIIALVTSCCMLHLVCVGLSQKGQQLQKLCVYCPLYRCQLECPMVLTGLNFTNDDYGCSLQNYTLPCQGYHHKLAARCNARRFQRVCMPWCLHVFLIPDPFMHVRLHGNPKTSTKTWDKILATG